MAAVLENRLVVVLLAAAMAVASGYLSSAALGHQGQLSTNPGASAGATPTGASSTCHLANGIEHVIYLQFDNLRLSRDQPSVPSDLEQMPHLLDFLQANGTLLTASHPPLVSGSGEAQVTSLTGLYPDHHNVPAPWPVFTRAGCDVGSVAGPADMVLRNTTSDLVMAFGAGSREAAEAHADSARAAADFTGLAIHCAGQTTACAGEQGGRPDRLPDELGGYSGFNALYGQRYVAPRIGVSGNLTDLGSNPIRGFPGFAAMTPSLSLAYVAAMQEHAVPITYAYIADAHDPRRDGNPLGPGEPAYVRQLHD